MNALAAAAVAVSQGVPAEAIAAGLSKVESVDGRLETVDAGQDFTIVVDYAHTPDALEKIHTRPSGAACRADSSRCSDAAGTATAGSGRSWARSQPTDSDVVVVTSDNPRGEEPAAIIDEIVDGRDIRRKHGASSR